MENKLIDKREKRLYYGLPQKDYIYSEDDVKEAVLKLKNKIKIDERNCNQESLLKIIKQIFGDFESKND